MQSDGRLSPQPLPRNEFSPGDLCTAYDRCLWLETLPTWNTDDEPEVEYTLRLPPSVAGRVLGYGLLYAPNDTGRDSLVRDILSCGEDTELFAGLADLYVYGLIHACASLRHLLLFAVF